MANALTQRLWLAQNAPHALLAHPGCFPSWSEAMSQIMPSAGTGGVYVFDTFAAPWTESGLDGVVQKMVRADRGRGGSLGLLSFNRTAASGLHQHHGVVSNFMLSGSLSDYQDDYPIGTAITNLAGTTHDEISWNGCMFVSRTEGPVVYLADANQSGDHDLFRNLPRTGLRHSTGRCGASSRR
jgi:hypothetical protein